MQNWMLNALLSMLFAGLTSIFAKYGLEKVAAGTTLLVRTAVIFVLVLAASFFTSSYAQVRTLSQKEGLLIAGSGLMAFLSWMFYFRALKDGPVTYVAAIDKGSIVVTLVLAFLLFKEPMKPQVLLGGGLVLAGLLVLVWK